MAGSAAELGVKLTDPTTPLEKLQALERKKIRLILLDLTTTREKVQALEGKKIMRDMCRPSISA